MEGIITYILGVMEQVMLGEGISQDQINDIFKKGRERCIKELQMKKDADKPKVKRKISRIN